MKDRPGGNFTPQVTLHGLTELSVIVLCSISVMHNRMDSSSGLSTGSGFDLIGPSSQSSKHLCIFGLYWCSIVYKCFFKNIPTSLYHVEGLAWRDWPFTWWTDQLLTFSALTLLVESSDP